MHKKLPAPDTKLCLHRETVRQLDAGQLVVIAGGALTAPCTGNRASLCICP